MANYSGTKYATSVMAIDGDCKGCCRAVTSIATIPAADAALAIGSIIKLVKIPAGHKVQKLSLFCGDLDADGSPAIVFTAGLMDASDTALETIFYPVADGTIGQAGGTLNTPSTTVMFTTEAAAVDKVLAIEVTTAAATKHAAARTIGCTVLYSAE